MAPGSSDSTWKRKDKAAFTIGLLVDDNELVHIINAKNAKEVSKALEDYHQKFPEASIVHSNRIRFSENMEDHVNKVQDLIVLVNN